MAINSKRLFFQELKDEYNAQFELSNALEAKGSRLTTVCGIFIPLIFGFSSSLFDKTIANTDPLSLLTGLLVTSLILAVASIFYSILAIRIKPYSHAFLPHDFYDKVTGELNQKEVKKYGDQDEDAFYDEMIVEYLESNTYNLKTNKVKARNIKFAQYLFLASLAIVPFLVMISFYSSFFLQLPLRNFGFLVFGDGLFFYNYLSIGL